ncbi:HNH endonuclease, partial [Bacillus amyloliquefaciens]|nr:HNH endonuclease [Bacillus amyloliquefaciens]
FWARVDQSGGIDACWPWIGATTYGYGVFGRGGKTKRAHRHVAEMAFGDLKGFFVCHACDDPGCCNPLHLFLGSHADNMADM